MKPSARVPDLLERALQMGISSREIEEQAGLSRAQVYRQLKAMEKGGELQKLARGVVRLNKFAGEPPLPLATDSGKRLWKHLTDFRSEAYISGLDVLAGRTHHQLFNFPHLVLTTQNRKELAIELEELGFFVVDGKVLGGAPDAVAIVREVGDWHRSGGVIGGIATPARAWLDLCREVQSGGIPMGAWELGVILASIQEAPEEFAQLKALAHRYGKKFVRLVAGAEQGTLGAELHEGVMS